MAVRCVLLVLAVVSSLGALSLTPGAAQAQAQAQARAPTASAPQTSLVPQRRPVQPGAMPGLVAGEGGIARVLVPPRRPTLADAQVPANMVPVATAGMAPSAPLLDIAEPPPVPAAMAGAGADPSPGAQRAGIAAASGPDPATLGPDRPDPAPFVAVVAAPPPTAVPPVRPSFSTPADPAAAPVVPALPPAARPARPPVVDRSAEPADPRAVASSLLPQPRTRAAQRRFETAAAALARATQRARAPIPQTPQAPAIQAALPAPPVAAAPSGQGLCGVAGLQGRRLPRVTSSTPGCGIDEPVSLTHAHGVRLNPPATLHCDAARATGRWVRDVVQPTIGRQGGGVVELRLGSHYACRARNNQRGARISEHGRGRAIDIMALRMANGEQVSILRDYHRGPYSAALRRMRAGACGIFRTTLGPGSDRFHADHFHFDVAQHRGGGTFCR